MIVKKVFVTNCCTTAMRGAGITQAWMFSCRPLEERISRKHPLRKLRAVVDGFLASMDEELDAV